MSEDATTKAGGALETQRMPLGKIVELLREHLTETGVQSVAFQALEMRADRLTRAAQITQKADRWTLYEIIELLEDGDFRCEAGSLSMSSPFIALKDIVNRTDVVVLRKGSEE